jgi:hypothetical protein
LETLFKHKARYQNKGNGFGYAIISLDGVANAIEVIKALSLFRSTKETSKFKDVQDNPLLYKLKLS